MCQLRSIPSSRNISIVLVLASAIGSSLYAQDETWQVEWVDAGGERYWNAYQGASDPLVTLFLPTTVPEDLDDHGPRVDAFLEDLGLGEDGRAAFWAGITWRNRTGPALAARRWRDLRRALSEPGSRSLGGNPGIRANFRMVASELAAEYSDGRWLSGDEQAFPHLEGGGWVKIFDRGLLEGTLDLGEVLTGEVVSREVLIKNYGRKEISNLRIHSDRGSFGVSPDSLSIGPQESATINIEVSASQGISLFDAINVSASGNLLSARPLTARVVLPGLWAISMGRVSLFLRGHFLSLISVGVLAVVLLVSFGHRPLAWWRHRKRRALLDRMAHAGVEELGTIKRLLTSVREAEERITSTGTATGERLTPGLIARERPLLGILHQTLEGLVKRSRGSDIANDLKELETNRRSLEEKMGGESATAAEFIDFMVLAGEVLEQQLRAAREAAFHHASIRDAEEELERLEVAQARVLAKLRDEEEKSVSYIREVREASEEARKYKTLWNERARRVKHLQSQIEELQNSHDTTQVRLANAQAELKPAQTELQTTKSELVTTIAWRNKAQQELTEEQEAHGETRSRLEITDSDRARAERELLKVRDDHEACKSQISNTRHHWQRLSGVLGQQPSAIEQGEADLGPIDTLASHAPCAFIPEHMSQFRNMLVHLLALFRGFAGRAPSPQSGNRFSKLLHYIHSGEMGNAGLADASSRLRTGTLFESLKAATGGMTSLGDLMSISEKAFFEDFIRPVFLPVLNQIARLYLLLRVPQEHLDVRGLIRESGIDPEEIVCAYVLATRTLRQHYDLHIRTVRLFEDAFDEEAHIPQPSASQAMTSLIPAAQSAVTALPRGVIYELYGVGLQSNKLGVDTLPEVIYKP